MPACGGDAGEHAPLATVLDGRSPRVAEGARTRVLVGLRRPALGARRGERPGAAEQRAYVRSLDREARALRGALRAKGVGIEDPVQFGRVWSGFAATVDTNDLPELQTLAARVEPVRRFFPAVASASRLDPPGAPLATAPADAFEVTGARAEADPPEALRLSRRAGSRVAGVRAEPAIALLDSGVDAAHPALAGRVDGAPALATSEGGGAGARGEHGTELAGVLAATMPRSERIVSIRVAGARRDPRTGARAEYGTTDEVVAGLERAVDPDGDGDSEDALAVALVGVNSPYAGFSRSPEARAAAAASALGTLVVAPAGNEGPHVGRYGTVGSPAAAPAALAVGALVGGTLLDRAVPASPTVRIGLATRHGRVLLEGALLAGRPAAIRAPAAALVGPSQAEPGGRGRSSGTAALEYFGVDARPRARGAVVFAPAPRPPAPTGPQLAAAAGAAAQAGAAALVVCADDHSRPAAMLPRGLARGMPVIGLTGERARQALALTRSSGGIAFLERPVSRVARGPRGGVAAGSSHGPTYALDAKPDLVDFGAAVTAAAGGGRAAVFGTSVAAARVAATALALHRRKPAAAPAELAAALVQTAHRAGAPLAAGAGRPNAAGAAAAAVIVEPRTLHLAPPALAAAAPLDRAGRSAIVTTGRARLSNRAGRPISVSLAVELDRRGAQVTVKPVRLELGALTNAPVTVRVRTDAPARAPLTGRLIVRGAGAPISVPVTLAAGPEAPARLGGLGLHERRGRVRGVRFVAGSVRRGGAGVAVEPLGRLTLELIDPTGAVVRELTPAGGAPDLLPGQYAYTLTRSILAQLPGGNYRFRASATGPEGGRAVVRRSREFAVP